MTDAVLFDDWWRERLAAGPLPTDAVVAALVPLLRQVATVHDEGLVAPLIGLKYLQVAHGEVFFPAMAALEPRRNPEVARLDRDVAAIEVERRTAVDLTGDQWRTDDRDVRERGTRPDRPCFYRGYVAWEHELEHHDPVTDVFSVGLLLASLSLGLHLAEEEHLRRFVANRRNPFALHADLNPVVGRVLARMCQPRRADRPKDLRELATLLANHREQASAPMPLALGARTTGPRTRRSRIHERLRDRLFDCSRRNRLLYYRPTQSHAAVTIASVPTRLAVDALKPDDLCTWRGAFAEAVLSLKEVNLGRWLRFEDAPWLAPTLERIRADERRDKAEYGASQLRLVCAFLRWHDLKEDKQERITSPLLLLPVALERRKGVRDAWTLTAAGTVAEVNPALRHHLRQLYNLELPESVDLAQVPADEIQARLQTAIQASEPGVTLRLIERPRIELVLEKARARAEQFRRKTRLTGRGVRRHGAIDYSFDLDTFAPLGLQLFLHRVKPSPAPLAILAGDDAGRERAWPITPEDAPPAPPPERAAASVGAVADGAVQLRESFVLKDDTEANPYQWDLDLCAVTLGNFNYRKMSLVRDYNALLQQDAPHAAFDGVFAEAPRPIDAAVTTGEPEWAVVNADPTQDAAVLRARTGGSYVIQGPPGTGKSQTITNLIADAVARGKRVLFVCAKRAALDVVHHRLAQRGLDRLCCLIHDSQDDKKPFIQDLRQQYESWLAQPDGSGAATARRDALTVELEAARTPLERSASALTSVDPQEGETLRTLIGRLVALHDREPSLADDEAEALPGYALWRVHGAAIASLGEAAAGAGRRATLAALGLRHVRRGRFAEERLAATLTDELARLGEAQATVERALAPIGGADALGAGVGELATLAAEARRLLVLADRDLLKLVDPHDPANEELRGAVRRRRQLAEAAAAAAAKTTHWRDPLPEQDCGPVLEQARALEGAWWRFASPAWWRLRRILRARYDLAQHVVAPRWSAVVADLAASNAARAALAAADRDIAATWRVDDLQTIVTVLADVQAAGAAASVRALRDHARTGRIGVDALRQLADAAPAIDDLTQRGDRLLGRWRDRTLAQLTQAATELRQDLPLLASLAAPLKRVAEAPDALWDVLRERPWNAAETEAALLRGALVRAGRRDPTLPRLDHAALADAAARLTAARRARLDANAETILACAHARFLEGARRSQLPGAPDAAEREWRRRYARGRRELEHEFAKVMRYRSIRDLADDETGLVLADLKPVWLMSPLSVSDTLPLANAGFDLVVFDEASQIPIEEAVPAMYRAPQAIVVGDRQQLPPTDFFATGHEDEPASTASAEEPVIDLEHDSFLTQAATNLPGIMLGWHYRSRSESLIAFSNALFYDGRLLTVPDVALDARRPAIRVESPISGDAATVLDRPISFHRLASSPYLDQRNHGEAVYVAHLLRDLLARQTKLTIGVVAFSQAQQGEIERAVDELGLQDAVFRERYEAECVREEHGQFQGLFIKNLENVQGDERDVVILSVCYGPDPSGRMLMNFGPINRTGGEKRLNVVFSRARHHMVVVASIGGDAIRNDYNDGANALKRYLLYAEAMSVGETARAARTLTDIVAASAVPATDVTDPVAEQLAAWLASDGWLLDRNVGRSDLRCDLAIRRSGDPRYRLGILIDREPRYRDVPLIEREVIRPALLGAFGWQVLTVRALDWLERRATIETAIRQRFAETVG